MPIPENQPMSAAQHHLVVRLEHEMVAPCCYSQVVADHMSGEAAQMRAEIVQLVLSGRTEQEIVEQYKARYGNVIMAAPDGLTGVAAVATPAVFSIAGIVFVIFALRRWVQRERKFRAERPPELSESVPVAIKDRIRYEIGEF